MRLPPLLCAGNIVYERPLIQKELPARHNAGQLTRPAQLTDSILRQPVNDLCSLPDVQQLDFRLMLVHDLT
jgi:hypothetical protein